MDFFDIIKPEEYEEVEYIGSLSYKAYKVNPQEVNDYLLNYLKDQNFDFIHFLAHPSRKVNQSFLNGKEKFVKLWEDCCFSEIGSIYETPACFRNYWMAKTPLFLDYCKFIKDFIVKVKDHPYAMENSHYWGGKLTKEKLQVLCGVPHYPILPFVIERCTVGYFLKQGLDLFFKKGSYLSLKKPELPLSPDFLEDNFNNTNKKLILYVFHELNTNSIYFLENGLYNDENTDFIIIINSKTLDLELIKKYTAAFYNVSLFQRDNIGFDFGGWYDALEENKLLNKYNYFLFVNSSVLGPFSHDEKWGENFFKDLYQKDNKIALSGTTINCSKHRFMHIQSMCFAIKFGYLKYLMNSKQIFFDTQLSKKQAIEQEIQISKLLIVNGYGIQTKMNFYLEQLQNKKGIFKNTYFKNKYGNVNILKIDDMKDILKDKYNLVFVKNDKKTQWIQNW